MKIEDSSYALRIQLDVSFDQTMTSVRAALKEQGFGILTEIDVRKTLKEKLDADFRRYVILGACNPPLAYRSLSTEIEIGLLLPCNVIVYEENDKTVVAALDPVKALSIVGENPALAEIALQARSKLKAALQSLFSELA